MSFLDFKFGTDAIIGAVIALLALIFFIVNAIYWSNIVEEFNTNSLKESTATISKSTAQFLMIASIIVAVIAGIYLLYNLGRWFFTSSRGAAMQIAITNAANSVKETAGDVKTKLVEYKNRAGVKFDAIRTKLYNNMSIRFNMDKLEFELAPSTFDDTIIQEDVQKNLRLKDGSYVDAASRYYYTTENDLKKFTFTSPHDPNVDASMRVKPVDKNKDIVEKPIEPVGQFRNGPINPDELKKPNETIKYVAAKPYVQTQTYDPSFRVRLSPIAEPLPKNTTVNILPGVPLGSPR